MHRIHFVQPECRVGHFINTFQFSSYCKNYSTSKWKEGGERNGGQERGSGVDGVDIAQPDLSLVYATPLLQHQAQLGLNPALVGI